MSTSTAQAIWGAISSAFNDYATAIFPVVIPYIVGFLIFGGVLWYAIRKARHPL